jgi:hypothetical protein
MLEIKAIGIGGIGCALLPFLCRYLQYSGEGARITLIDGDRFERGNAARQAFSGLGNKAGQVPGAGGSSGPLLPGGGVRHRSSVARLVTEGDLAFMVDNHASRLLVSRQARRLRTLPDLRQQRL